MKTLEYDKEFVVAALEDRIEELKTQYRQWIYDNSSVARTRRAVLNKDLELCNLTLDLITVGLDNLSDSAQCGLEKLIEPQRGH